LLRKGNFPYSAQYYVNLVFILAENGKFKLKEKY